MRNQKLEQGQQVVLKPNQIFLDNYAGGVRDTSKQAFNDIIDKLPMSRLKVFRAIQENGNKASNHQVSAKLGWGINRVTPRMQELRNIGLVRFAGKSTDKISGKSVCLWEIV